jgi:hypothetical protein
VTGEPQALVVPPCDPRMEGGGNPSSENTKIGTDSRLQEHIPADSIPSPKAKKVEAPVESIAKPLTDSTLAPEAKKVETSIEVTPEPQDD